MPFQRTRAARVARPGSPLNSYPLGDDRVIELRALVAASIAFLSLQSCGRHHRSPASINLLPPIRLQPSTALPYVLKDVSARQYVAVNSIAALPRDVQQGLAREFGGFGPVLVDPGK